ncbi:hypothetical protein C451_19903 [Halococcus thailandensis JCM 13552]|uniref:Uncharacterized protein n=1 Tax=Halococcus thailandensis JCM 13552 TaxID=1227457 RepID=M0MWL3_9EURY|nr:hypothetical protein C451_19903 [Halococcus thailandensis JCM 13552]
MLLFFFQVRLDSHTLDADILNSTPGRYRKSCMDSGDHEQSSKPPTTRAGLGYCRLSKRYHLFSISRGVHILIPISVMKLSRLRKERMNRRQILASMTCARFSTITTGYCRHLKWPRYSEFHVTQQLIGWRN